MDDYVEKCRLYLTTASIAPEKSWQKRSKIVTAENGKSYVLLLSPPKECAVYPLDGKIHTPGRKCDKLVLVQDDDISLAVFVELKGHDIIHAIDQLEATLKLEQFSRAHTRNKPIRARIVTNGCGPASSSKKTLSDAKIRFEKNYNCDLRVIKTNQSDQTV